MRDTCQSVSSERAAPGASGTRRVLAIAWRYGRWPAALYLLVCLLMMFFEESLIFVPARYTRGDWQPEGLPVEDAWFEASDGTRLHGWFVARESPRAIVLFCHGNAGNVTNRAFLLRDLRDRLGVSALVFDYRGYGRSEGRPSEEGILQDARAARTWLADRADVAESEIVLMGRSLGGAVAVDLAAEEGGRALILESTFASLPDVAAHHYPWLPVRMLMRTRLDSVSKIGRYDGPLFQSHGTADRVVPLASGRRLFEAAGQPKRFVELPGADHNSPYPRDYYRKLSAFLDAHSPNPPEAAMILEESLIFFPDRYPEGDWQPEGLSPEDAWFTAADGTRLHGWYLDHPEPQATILFSHGNAGNLSHRAEKVRVLRRFVDAAVLVYDYRGYGRSEGRPCESGILADGRAARDWLARRAGVDAGRIVLLGESLGGAVSVDLAASGGARAVVLEGAFTSIPDVAAVHYPWLPVRLMLRTRLDTLSRIADCRTAVLICHGEADTVVPLEQGRRLFQAAGEPKQLLVLPGADHNDPLPPLYYETLREFLAGLPE